MSSEPAGEYPGSATAISRAGVCDGASGAVNEVVEGAQLVDHHVHGIVRGRLEDAAVEDMLIESDRTSARIAAGHDTQLWFAIRRWCSPLLGLPASATAAAYLGARSSLPNEDVAARLLPAAGFSMLIVETGFRGDLVTTPRELGALAHAPTRAVLRLEALAERLIGELADPSTYPAAFRRALADATEGPDAAIGTKTILAYRGGFDRDLSRPPDEEVGAAAVRWASAAGGVDGTSRPRLVDDALLRFGIWTALDRGLPLQVHTGFGDPDLDLHQSNPLLLTPLIRMAEGRASILLLHTYPYQREAGYLAQMFPDVFLDVGLGVTYAGAAATTLIAESLELAPFSKILFSSDGWGAPELHLLGSWLWRRAVSRVVGEWVTRGDWSIGDAERLIGLAASENARRVYRLS